MSGNPRKLSALFLKMEDFNGVIGLVYQKGDPNIFVLIHNQKTGNISFPAGGREERETSSEQSLERELREETGLSPDEYRIIKTPIVHEFVYGKKKEGRAGQIAKQPVYLIETNKSELTPKDPDAKIDGWYTEEEVLERLTFDDAKELFKKAIKYIS